MKRPLSVFSFKMPARARRFPRAAGMAVLLLLLSESAARIAISRGWLTLDFSLRRLTQESLERLRRDQPTIWLLGNSILRRGIDKDVLAREMGSRAIQLAHGTASLAGSVAMMKFYLSRVTQPPERVIFFVSKDDLNRHGYRARVSQTYLDLGRDGPSRFDLDDWLALSAARGQIVRSFQAGLASLLLPSGVPARKPRPAADDGKPITLNDPHFADLARNYELDLGAVAELGAICRRRGIRRTQMVLMPVTGRYIEFHEALFPEMPYREIRRSLAAACEANGIRFVDYGGPTNEYYLFSDPYHLNDAGKRKISEVLSRELFARQRR